MRRNSDAEKFLVDIFHPRFLSKGEVSHETPTLENFLIFVFYFLYKTRLNSLVPLKDHRWHRTVGFTGGINFLQPFSISRCGSSQTPPALLACVNIYHNVIAPFGSGLRCVNDTFTSKTSSHAEQNSLMYRDGRQHVSQFDWVEKAWIFGMGKGRVMFL